MAEDEKNKVGTAAEYDLRGDDRVSSTGYGKPRRRNSSLAFIAVTALICVALAFFLHSRRGEVAGIPRERAPGEAVTPVPVR